MVGSVNSGIEKMLATNRQTTSQVNFQRHFSYKRKCQLTKQQKQSLYQKVKLWNYCKKLQPNLSPECRKALSELKMLYDKRPFDKGVGFCLMTLEDYITSKMVHLSDTDKYQTIEDPAKFATEIIKKIIH